MESSQDLNIPRRVPGSRREVRDQALGRTGPRPLGGRWSVRGGGDVHHQPGRAAPVRWCRDHLPADDIRAVVINAGNANAATGAQARQRRADRGGGGELPGMPARATPGWLDGRHRPPAPHGPARGRIVAGLEPALRRREQLPDNAAQAILTTDTRAKVVSTAAQGQSGMFTLFGMAKGAAMIGPRMATMLAFLLTDAPVLAQRPSADSLRCGREQLVRGRAYEHQ